MRSDRKQVSGVIREVRREAASKICRGRVTDSELELNPSLSSWGVTVLVNSQPGTRSFCE